MKCGNSTTGMPLFVKKKKYVNKHGQTYNPGEPRPRWNQRVPSLQQGPKHKQDATAAIAKSSEKTTNNYDGMDVSERPAVTTGEWATVYSNKVPKLKLLAPSSRSVEWKFRVRAKNSQGWSKYSPVLYMHAKNHPSLFSAVYPQEHASHVRYCNTPNALLSPDKKSDALGLAVARPEYATSPISATGRIVGFLGNNAGYGMYSGDYPQYGPGGFSPNMNPGQDGMYVDSYTQGLMYEAIRDMDQQQARQAMPGMLEMNSLATEEDEMLENMPLSAGDSGVLQSRQRPSSADSAESASMLDRRSRDSNRNSGRKYSRGGTGDRRKSAPPKQSGNHSGTTRDDRDGMDEGR